MLGHTLCGWIWIDERDLSRRGVAKGAEKPLSDGPWIGIKVNSHFFY